MRDAGVSLGEARKYGVIKRGAGDEHSHPLRSGNLEIIHFSNPQRIKILDFWVLAKKTKYKIRNIAKENGITLNNKGQFGLNETSETIKSFLDILSDIGITIKLKEC